MFDQTGDVPVGQPLGADLAADDPPEHRPDRNPRKLQPGLERDDRAGGLRGAAADLDLPPAGLPPQRQQQSVVEKFDPAAGEAVLGAAIEADDFRAAQAAGETDEEDGAVAQAPEIAEIERGDHGEEVLGQDGLLLLGRAALGAADPGEHGGDVPVLAVHRLAALGEIPHERREAPLDGADRARLRAGRAGGAGGDVEAENLRIRGQGREVLPPRPGRNNGASRRRRRGWCFATSRRGRSRGRSRRAARGARAGEGADRRPAAAPMTGPRAVRRASGGRFRPFAGSNRA